MTFDEIFESHKGYWDGIYAMVHDGAYVKCVAVGQPDMYELTDFGKSLMQLETSSATRVQSKKKPVKASAPAATDDDFDLDDI